MLWAIYYILARKTEGSEHWLERNPPWWVLIFNQVGKRGVGNLTASFPGSLRSHKREKRTWG